MHPVRRAPRMAVGGSATLTHDINSPSRSGGRYCFLGRGLPSRSWIGVPSGATRIPTFLHAIRYTKQLPDCRIRPDRGSRPMAAGGPRNCLFGSYRARASLAWFGLGARRQPRCARHKVDTDAISSQSRWNPNVRVRKAGCRCGVGISSCRRLFSRRCSFRRETPGRSPAAG
jgi:hypothetical protein